MAKFYIEVKCGREFLYVTNIEGSNAVWEEGKPALRLTRKTADSVCKALNMNGYDAQVVIRYNIRQPVNPIMKRYPFPVSAICKQTLRNLTDEEYETFYRVFVDELNASGADMCVSGKRLANQVIQDDQANKLLVSLCGMSADTLLFRAGIIPGLK